MGAGDETPALGRVEGYWSSFLGVPRSALREPGIRLVEHARLAGWSGVWFFVRGGSAVVSVPPGRIASLREAVDGEPVRALLVRERMAERLGVDPSALVGPSFQGWLDPACFRSESSGRARRLGERDRAALAALRSGCSAKDWEHSGLDETAPQPWGAFAGAELAAVAGIRVRGEGACDPCVLAHPAHRGRGLARSALAAAVAHALGEGSIVLYQTLLSNGPAVALARGLGFEAYATLLAARLPEVS
jgi:GNAT superfamily N-acetyltransferase